jgi:hypothetical protein
VDGSRFDLLVKILFAGGTRRGVLWRLTVLPLVGALAALIGEGAGAAKRRVGAANHKHAGRRRKHKHHHKQRRKGKRKQRCAQAGDAPTNGKRCCARLLAVDGACQPCDVCASGCAFTSVQAAIDAADPGDTIAICAGAYTGAGGRVTIGKDVNLIGAGDDDDPASNTILDAEETGRVVVIEEDLTVSLEGLRITGGFASGLNDDGGGVFNFGSVLTMTGCTVIANSTSNAGGNGGGIANISGIVTLAGCRVDQNTADTTGGGIFSVTGTVTLNGCSVDQNIVNGEGGGISSQAGTLTLNDSCLTGNSANGPGGGLHVVGGGTATLDGSSVTGNTAGQLGGGIRNENGIVTLQNGSIVEDNEPDNCVGTVTGLGCAP